MIEEEKKDQETSEQKPKKSNSPLMTYVIIAVGTLAITIGSMLALIKPPVANEAGDDDGYASDEYEEAGEDSDKEDMEVEDIFSGLADLSFLEATPFSNPKETIVNEDGSISSNGEMVNEKDTLTAEQWIEREKNTLATEKAAQDRRERELNLRERDIDQKLTKLQQIEASKYNDLAKLYDGMKPEQVARLIIKLDNKTIVAILPRMKRANASKILGLLPPERGARISREMIAYSGK